MIIDFAHKGLEAFFRTGSKAGINASHATRIQAQLSALDAAARIDDMNLPAWRLHPLHGALAGHWSIRVNASWRITFTLANGEARIVDYQDYH